MIVLIARGEEENKFKMSKKNSKLIMNAIKHQSKMIDDKANTLQNQTVQRESNV